MVIIPPSSGVLGAMCWASRILVYLIPKPCEEQIIITLISQPEKCKLREVK